MSKFLDDFAQYIRETQARVFSIAEIVGNNAPEKTAENFKTKRKKLPQMHGVAKDSL